MQCDQCWSETLSSRKRYKPAFHKKMNINCIQKREEDISTDMLWWGSLHAGIVWWSSGRPETRDIERPYDTWTITFSAPSLSAMLPSEMHFLFDLTLVFSFECWQYVVVLFSVLDSRCYRHYYHCGQTSLTFRICWYHWLIAVINIGIINIIAVCLWFHYVCRALQCPRSHFYWHRFWHVMNVPVGSPCVLLIVCPKRKEDLERKMVIKVRAGLHPDRFNVR